MLVTCDLKDLKIIFLFEKAQRPQNRCKVLAVKCKKVLHFRCIFSSIFPTFLTAKTYVNSYAISTKCPPTSVESSRVFRFSRKEKVRK